jgi:excisionase family DNA binding protein
MDEFMTTAEAAEILGLHPASISRLVKQGKIEGERFGRDWMVSKRSVEDYLKRFGDLPKHSPKRKKAAE